MPGTRDKVIVAMSGGVDSSVAACLLVEQGYEVMGFFMRVGAADSPANADRSRDREGADHSTDASGMIAGGEAFRVPAARSVSEASRGLTLDTSRQGEQPAARDNVVPTDGENVGRAMPAFAHSDSLPTPNLTLPVRQHQGCCSASDAADARFVAGMLGIPFYALNFEADFDRIIDYFADEYVRGRTPNPCVVCNDKLKFGKLLDYADAVGAKYIATGHYAQIGRQNVASDQTLTPALSLEGRGGTVRNPTLSVERRGRQANMLGGKPVLMRGRDRKKDQSYVLFGLRREVLDRVKFPIGHLTKDEVRSIAAKHHLPNRDKPDSVEICFVPDRDYARVVRERHPRAFAPGEVVDADGSVIGRHDGVANFTVGQRRGLRIAAGKPIYVTQLEPAANRVVMGDRDALLALELVADRVNLLVDGLGEVFRAEVKIRYLHNAAPATVHRLAGDRVRVYFEEPQRAIAPGQAVVFYDGEVVLGGGWIEG
ncbi:MAG: tRNA 2-thiouridine(34) synthase MnmA [Planctomycetota bacterium]